MNIEARLAELERKASEHERRLEDAERRNRELQGLLAKEEERQELTSLESVRIKELARDVNRFGFDAAMAMHGRKVQPRGRQKRAA
ncbi:MAG TPA: hypothetical protein VI298_08585 [Geobacteraceae bacterium]